MNLKFIKKYRSIETFNETEINNFSIFTGVNGSGKTHILEGLKDGSIQVEGVAKENIVYFNFSSFLLKNQPRASNVNIAQLKTQAWSLFLNQKQRFAGIDGQIKSLLNSKVQFFYKASINDIKEDKEEMYKSLVQQADNLIVSFVKSNPKQLALLRSAFHSTDKPFSEILEEDFIEKLSVSSIDYQLLDNLSEVFLEYKKKLVLSRLDKVNGGYGLSDEEIDKLEKDSPWSLINSIFEGYNLEHRVSEPSLSAGDLINNPNSSFQVELKVQGVSIQFEQLSSGEKILVALAITIFQNDKTKFPELILLDEIDATLHPSMIAKTLDVIKDVFIGKGSKVIMATHSPTTIAHAPEKSIYEIIKGSCENKIVKIDKNKALDILTNGFATLNEAKLVFENILSSGKNVILFTEGETDITHIETAKEKLNITDLDFDVFACNGADKLKQFLMGIPNGLVQDKKIIGIFDYDQEGIKSAKGLGSQLQEDSAYKRNDMENIFSITLPCPDDKLKTLEYCPIEFLYPKEKIDSVMLCKRNLKDVNNKYDNNNQISSADFANMEDLFCFQLSKNSSHKTDFASKISEFEESDFRNFRPLFDKIKSLVEVRVEEAS
ncbi:ATP-dependent nuclease [Francisella hispaniensis]|uniref:ATP-dependent nuclease n=1 Tax=Francisella hispaniensis TaxID=622488 RepID=UPI001903FC88|nr:AAA family ATPase [Francisella hispaniensis]MBK2356469.1 AAA family ATPase [Francisella hispaniensis]